MIWLRSLLFTALLFLSVPVHATAVVLVSPFGHGACYRVAVNWARVNLWLLKHLCGLDWTAEGLEHVPAESSVLYCKHQSVLEALVCAVLFPPQCWVAKRELLWIPFFGWGLARLKPIAIDRKAGRRAVRQVIAQGQARLADGLWVVIFPEGTRVLPGKTRHYGISGAALARAARKPLLPIAHNAGDYWPRRSFLKHPGTMRMVIGPPVPTANRTPEQITRAARQWIEATMARVSPAEAAAAAAGATPLAEPLNAE